MSAALTSYEGEPVSPALVIGSPEESSYYLTRRKAQQLTDQIRQDLTGAVIGLQLAREGHAHLALGYEHWHDYCISEFGDIKELRLPVAERRALVASMCDAGLSVRDIRNRIGFSVGTIQGDRQALGYAQQPVEIAPEPEPEPIGHLPKTEQIVVLIAREDSKGLTCREIELITGWHHGVSSGPLSRSARPGRVHRIPLVFDGAPCRVVHTGQIRNGYGAYRVERIDPKS